MTARAELKVVLVMAIVHWFRFVYYNEIAWLQSFDFFFKGVKVGVATLA